MKNLLEGLRANLPEWPVLSAGEQTRLSWARRIESIEELPACYQGYVGQLVAQTGKFPYAVLTPTFAGYISRTTEKLLCVTPDALHCMERIDDQAQATVFCLDAISYVEAGCILLNSWLKLCGQDASGAHATVKFKFNTVTDRLFTPVVETIRRQYTGGRETDLRIERAKFDYLIDTQFKFMNAARRSLVVGETVQESLMQPELRTPVMTLFGHAFYRTKAPAHIMILTDAELIVVADEKRDSWGGDVKHGSISTYIPLAKIARVDCQVQDSDVWLNLGLPGGETLDFCFAGAQQPAVAQLVEHISAQGVMA